MLPKKRIKFVLIFYLMVAALVWLSTRLRPLGTDGGWGLNAVVIIVVLFVIALLAIINFYRGFKRERTFFILGLLHLLVLLTGIYFLLL